MGGDVARPQRLTRAETKVRTRALLLEAAATVFARKGFAGASVDDIAETAGFTTGALYSNFSSKDELFIELLSGRSGSRLAEAAEIVSEQATGVQEVRRRLDRLLVEVADDDADLAPLQAEFWLYAIRRPKLLEQHATRFRANRDALSTVLAHRARDRGQRAGVDSDALATVLLALFQGLVQLRRTDPALVPDELYGTATHWLFGGINEAVSGSSDM